MILHMVPQKLPKMRKGLGRNSFLFGDKEGRSQASVAIEKDTNPNTALTAYPDGDLEDGLPCSGSGTWGHQCWLNRLFH